MDELVITWRELLVVAILILLVYAGEMLLFIRSGGTRQRRKFWRNDEAAVAASPRDSHLLREEVAELRNELAELRGEVEVLKNLQVSGNSPYAQAIEMAKEGHEVGEVAAACGISRGEAELIVAVHRVDGT